MDTLFPMDDTQPLWIFDPKRGAPGIFLRELLLLETVSPLKEIRRVLFHAGLNIVWADPKTDTAKKGGSRLAGHSAGKTTFCRLLRWLLGEARFGHDDLQAAVGRTFPKGWALLHLELEGTSWVIGRSLWDTSKHWAVPANSINELLASGIPDKADTDAFFTDLEDLTIKKLGHRTLPGSTDPLKWTDLLAWLARDQDAALQTIEAWRANTSTISRNIAAKDSRHTIMRLALELLDTQEWREKDKCARLEATKDHESKRKPDLEAAAIATSESLRYILGKGEKSLTGGLLLSKASKKVEDLASKQTDLNKQLSALDPAGAENEFQQAADARAKHEQKITSTKRNITMLSNRIDQRKADLIAEKQRDIETRRGLPPGICGRKKEEVDGRCEFYTEAPQPMGTPQTSAEIANNRDGFLEQRDLEQAELELAMQDLPLLKETETTAKSKRDEIQSECQRLQNELAVCTATLDASKAILEIATSANDLRDSNESELKTLKDSIKESNQRQSSIRDSHKNREARLNFAIFYQRILRELTGPDTTGTVEYDADGLLKLTAKTREKISSAAIEALKVVAFDLAVIFWSARGHGHHPRFLIHDSPRVADMSAVPYAAIFELVQKAEEHSKGQPNFQYIITTTESPPDDLKDHHLSLSLDASRAEGRLLGVDF
jgi:hypothetical protein